ncbi:alpha/beta-hydrolase, protein [Acrodontium crateriforme]|uniref:Carboxypeptidase n=1 Tax=Acrodontium crateriforme TaxID=150365 RepID=A0AAQ3M526_9PEZI|nr:alpha/beta-hydrolase, protein [Acrodontium crateriforme]
MQLSLLATLLLAGSAIARAPPKGAAKRAPVAAPDVQQLESSTKDHKPIIPQNSRTRKFAVNGHAIPEVDFHVGESYAGLLPISDQKDSSELYFWFFPSRNHLAKDEILIWLNGGPGCSSLEGLLQENGPFSWQYGTYKPVRNPWSWTNLTNVVWVEQPAGTGFSKKNKSPSATNEIEVAEQFLGWFKNFVDTFSLHGKKVYIAGESYAGYYVPYIADAMHNATNTHYYNIQSILIYDPSLSYGTVQENIPAVPFVDYHANLFNLNKTTMDYLHRRHKACGYADFLETALQFPPKGPLPTPPNVSGGEDDCNLYYSIQDAVLITNPCWDIYQVATTCPLLWDVLGFPGSIPYLPDGATIYFNRTDVQQAINAPIMPWAECADYGVLDQDNSPPSALSVLPRVIEKNKQTIIGHGLLDFVLMYNGTLVAIQNMTWHGHQGFSKAPSQWNDFFVPYHYEPSLSTYAASGNMGQYHTERNLTMVTIALSGHMVPQYAPSAAYRQVEFLLGRIENLGVRGDFTTQKGDYGN